MRRALLVALAAVSPLLGGCVLFYLGDGPRSLPEWRAEATVPRTLGCARVTARVVQSGKEGVGIVVALEGTGNTCILHISAATLRVGSVETRAADLPPPPRLTEGARVEAHLAFRFDADAAWRRGDRHGELTLRLASGEQVALPLAAWDEDAEGAP
jgi:hypothetical protein